MALSVEDAQSKTLQVFAFWDGGEYRMIWAGAIDRFATQRAASVLRGINDHVVKYRSGDVMRTRKGREYATWGEHPQGTKMDFFIATHGTIDGGARAGEAWWIEHDQIKMCSGSVELI